MARVSVLLLGAALSLSLAGALVTEAGQGKKVQPRNLGKVNTAADETDPFETPDGRGLLYASNKAGTYDLMGAVRENKELPWGEGEPLTVFNTRDADERSPFLTPNKTLFFASDQVPDPSFKKLQNFDIFIRPGQQAPYRLRLINTKRDEMFPWLTQRGDEFYFSRKTEEGWRLFVSRVTGSGSIGEGQLVKELAPDFHHATLSPDGLTMYLQGPLPGKRWGLFRSTRARAGAPWALPKAILNLGSKDGKQGDLAPALSRDGRTLYFASDRPGGQGGLDLWSVPTAALQEQ